MNGRRDSGRGRSRYRPFTAALHQQDAYGYHSLPMRRIALACLAVIAATLGAAAARPAMAATARAATSTLSIWPAQPAIDYGASVRLEGLLSVDGVLSLPPLPVTLLARPAGTADFVAVGTTAVDADGGFAFSHTPSVSTAYRAEFAGAAEIDAPPSRPAEVVVQVRSAISLKVPARMWIGEAATFSGTVTPSRPAGTEVTIQRRLSGSWQNIFTTRLDAQSSYAILWTPVGRGDPVFRASVAADTLNAAGVSPIRTAPVRDPNPHGVPQRLPKVIVIDHSEYRLYYYQRGHVIRDFPCVLGKRSTPTPLGRFRIQRKRPHPGGANGAYYMGYRGIIGIHGTNQPHLLGRFPRAFSHGCARLYNRDITWLYARTPIRTPVWNVR